MKETPTVPLFLRLRPQVKRAFDAEARRCKLGKAAMFERMMRERVAGKEGQP